jgi:hypothetical protein
LVFFVGLSIACDVFGFKKVDPGILPYKMVHGHDAAGMMSSLLFLPSSLWILFDMHPNGTVADRPNVLAGSVTETLFFASVSTSGLVSQYQVGSSLPQAPALLIPLWYVCDSFPIRLGSSPKPKSI